MKNMKFTWITALLLLLFLLLFQVTHAVPAQGGLTLEQDVLDYGPRAVGYKIHGGRIIGLTNNSDRTMQLSCTQFYFGTALIDDPVLSPGESTSLLIGAASDMKEGVYEDVVVVTSTAGDRVELTIKLAVIADLEPAKIVLEGDLDFGTVKEGYEPESRTVTMTNVGGEATEYTVEQVKNFFYDCCDEGQYSFWGSLMPGEVLQFTVTPKAQMLRDTYEATLIAFQDGGYPSDDEEEPKNKLKIKLTVEAGEESIAVSPQKIDFGDLQPGYTQPEAKTVTVRNAGPTQVSLKFSGAETKYFELGTLRNGVLGPAGRNWMNERDWTTFTVCPKAGLPEGEYRETVTIETREGNQVQVELVFSVGMGRSASPFADVTEKDWFFEAVRYNYDYGMMNGTGNGLFSPEGSTSRAMIVTILHRLEGEPIAKEENPFSDVAEGKWYTNAVVWAAEQGIITGYGNGRFGPDDNISREQLTTILMRYADYKKYDTTARGELDQFTDGAQVSGWAKEAVAWAAAANVIDRKERGVLEPTRDALRCEAAAMLHNFCLGPGA